jgi:diguanylate cyclase (GGDEF)-like protein/PAS domain S-box-containing protein
LQRAAGQPLKEILGLRHLDDSGPIEISVDVLNQTNDRERTGRSAIFVAERNAGVTVEFKAIAIRDARGNCSGAVLTLRDISRRRAAELALQSSEETLLANADELFEEKERAQVTLNSIGDAVISTDFRGRVNFLNVVAERMTGHTQAEAAGRTIDEVFRLVDSTNREQIRCPTMTAIIENLRVDLDAGCSLIQKNGEEIAVEGSAAPIHDKGGGVSGAVMVARDVTAARGLSKKLARLALHDTLTDLPNRTLFGDRLDQALARADRNGNSVAVLFVDLDRFKPVNDSLGHAAGDQLLQAVAGRLRTCVRSSDTICRYGGDEFLILLAYVASHEDAAVCADKVKSAFDTPYEINAQKLCLTSSIGIATFPEDALDAVTLLKCADIAMYEAKCNGRNSYRWFRQNAQPADFRPMGAAIDNG